MQDHINRHVYAPLRITFGVVPIVAGIDKFSGLLADWTAYLSPLAGELLPFEPMVAMYFVGVVEILVGVAVLTRFTRYGALLASAWLTLIAVNLLSMGVFDIAVRDLVMAVAAYALASLAVDAESASSLEAG